MAQRPVEIILTRQLADSLSTPMFVIDPEGDLVFYNEPAEILLGRRYAEAEEMSLADLTRLFEPSDSEGRPLSGDDLPMAVALHSGAPHHSRLRIVGLDGVARFLEATSIPLAGQGGRLLGVMTIFWELPGQ